MPNSDKVLIHAMSGCTGHLLTYLVSVRVVTVVGLVFFFPRNGRNSALSKLSDHPHLRGNSG